MGPYKSPPLGSGCIYFHYGVNKITLQHRKKKNANHPNAFQSAQKPRPNHSASASEGIGLDERNPAQLQQEIGLKMKAKSLLKTLGEESSASSWKGFYKLLWFGRFSLNFSLKGFSLLQSRVFLGVFFSTAPKFRMSVFWWKALPVLKYVSK